MRFLDEREEDAPPRRNLEELLTGQAMIDLRAPPAGQVLVELDERQTVDQVRLALEAELALQLSLVAEVRHRSPDDEADTNDPLCMVLGRHHHPQEETK